MTENERSESKEFAEISKICIARFIQDYTEIYISCQKIIEIGNILGANLLLVDRKLR
jgi:hypothetical protein